MNLSQVTDFSGLGFHWILKLFPGKFHFIQWYIILATGTVTSQKTKKIKKPKNQLAVKVSLFHSSVSLSTFPLLKASAPHNHFCYHSTEILKGHASTRDLVKLNNVQHCSCHIKIWSSQQKAHYHRPKYSPIVTSD
jgi:hypothetical protein